MNEAGNGEMTREAMAQALFMGAASAVLGMRLAGQLMTRPTMPELAQWCKDYAAAYFDPAPAPKAPLLLKG